jgi:hypothetical protein
MKRPRLRVSYSTRPINSRALGSGRTDDSQNTKPGGVKKLSDKGKDRVPCKTKR